MSYTLTQRIFMKNTGRTDLKVGDIVMVTPDVVLLQEYYTAPSEKFFREAGFTKIKYPDRVVLFIDHDVPVSMPGAPDTYNATLRFAEKYGITHVHVGEGILHTVFHERRYGKPGYLIFGCDSHCGTAGAGACFSCGNGHPDMCSIFGTGEVWARVPAAIKIVVDGELPKGVYAKDISLRVLHDLKADGAQYKSIEFCGSTIRSMSMDARYTLSNMGIECGAKNCIVEADEKTAEYFGMDYKDIEWLKVGPDDAYSKVLHYRAEDLVPLLSCPPKVDNVHPISEVEGTKVTQIYFGSCTNSSLEDVEIFANILRGHKVDKHIKLLISLGSVDIFNQATKKGWIQDILDAGGMFIHPSCNLCCGTSFGVMDENGVMLATNNRNFRGRQGHRDSKCFLCSPATAAASAISGVISDPRSVL